MAMKRNPCVCVSVGESLVVSVEMHAMTSGLLRITVQVMMPPRQKRLMLLYTNVMQRKEGRLDSWVKQAVGLLEGRLRQLPPVAFGNAAQPAF